MPNPQLEAGRVAQNVDGALRNTDTIHRQNLLETANQDLSRISTDRTAMQRFNQELQRRGDLPGLVIEDFGSQATLNRLGLGNGVDRAELQRVAQGQIAGSTQLDRVAAGALLESRMRNENGELTPQQITDHFQRVNYAGGLQRAQDSLSPIWNSIASNGEMRQADITRVLGNQHLTNDQRESLEFLRDNFGKITEARGAAETIFGGLRTTERPITLERMRDIMNDDNMRTALNDYRTLRGQLPTGVDTSTADRTIADRSVAQSGDGPDRIARRMLGPDASARDVFDLSTAMMERFVQNHPDRHMVNRNGRMVLDRLFVGEQLVTQEDLEQLSQRVPALQTARRSMLDAGSGNA